MVETINVAKDAMIKAVTKLKPGDRADIAYTPAVGSTSIEADNGPRSHLAALAQETIRGLSFVRHAGAWNRRDGRKLSFTLCGYTAWRASGAFLSMTRRISSRLRSGTSSSAR